MHNPCFSLSFEGEFFMVWDGFLENVYICSRKYNEVMGQLAFIKLFMLVSIPTDINDNRRHVHVFYRNGRQQHSVAKIWIEKNGERCIEIAESKLSQKENKMLVDAISNNWEFINEQITRCFNGEKTRVRNIE